MTVGMMLFGWVRWRSRRPPSGWGARRTAARRTRTPARCSPLAAGHEPQSDRRRGGPVRGRPYLLSCSGSDGGGELCLSDNATQCPGPNAVVGETLGSCHDLCRPDEFAVACGRPGPGPWPSPPAECRSLAPGPGGGSVACCPCGGDAHPSGRRRRAVRLRRHDDLRRLLPDLSARGRRRAAGRELLLLHGDPGRVRQRFDLRLRDHGAAELEAPAAARPPGTRSRQNRTCPEIGPLSLAGRWSPTEWIASYPAPVPALGSFKIPNHRRRGGANG